MILSWRRAWCSIILLVMFLACNAALANAPFGFEVNVSPSQYEFCSPSERRDVYLCTGAPKPHGAFDTYILWYFHNIGLCKTVAVGNTIENDAYGELARKRTDKIARQIEKKYGPATDKCDFLNAGSIWDEARDWMRALSRNERSYVYSWSRDRGYIPVGNVDTILLQVRGDNASEGYITAAFEFGNMSRCTSAKNEAESDAF